MFLRSRNHEEKPESDGRLSLGADGIVSRRRAFGHMGKFIDPQKQDGVTGKVVPVVIDKFNHFWESLKMRVREVERRLHRDLAPALPIPHLVTIGVNSRAPALNPGPIRWGTIPGIPTVFERGPDESDDDFVDRLATHALTTRTPFACSSEITIHAETLKPEPSAMSS